jgi:hypothetical protein
MGTAGRQASGERLYCRAFPRKLLRIADGPAGRGRARRRTRTDRFTSLLEAAIAFLDRFSSEPVCAVQIAYACWRNSKRLARAGTRGPYLIFPAVPTTDAGLA